MREKENRETGCIAYCSWPHLHLPKWEILVHLWCSVWTVLQKLSKQSNYHLNYAYSNSSMSNVKNEWKAILITTKQSVNHATTIGYLCVSSLCVHSFTLLTFIQKKISINLLLFTMSLRSILMCYMIDWFRILHVLLFFNQNFKKVESNTWQERITRIIE